MRHCHAYSSAAVLKQHYIGADLMRLCQMTADTDAVEHQQREEECNLLQMHVYLFPANDR